MSVVIVEDFFVVLLIVLSNAISVALTCWCLRRRVLEPRPQVPEAQAPAAQPPAAQPAAPQATAAQAPAFQLAGPFSDMRLITIMHTKSGEVWHLSPDCPSLVSNRWVQQKRPCGHCVH